MRVIFVLCLTLCTVAVAAPMVGDQEVVSTVALASAVRPDPTANPSEVVVKVTPSPTPTPMPVRQNPIVRPKAAVAPVATPPPTAAPTPDPTPKATAKPAAKTTPKPTAKATAQPTAKPTSSPTGKTYTRQEVIAGIRSGWGGNDEKAIKVADCESGLNPRASSPGEVYLGLWQFHIETWRGYGGNGDPRDHSPHVQTQVAWAVFQDHRWDAWPGCA